MCAIFTHLPATQHVRPLETTLKQLVVVGDGACGKTCLLIMKAEGKFPKEYVPTVFENHVTFVQLPEAKVELALWDTAGQEDYAHIRPLSYDAAHVFLICCSVDSKASFRSIKEKWIGEIKETNPKCPIVIVGCKGDMRADGKAQYSVEEAHELAVHVGAIAYIECSARSNAGVDEVFFEAAKIAYSGIRKGIFAGKSQWEKEQKKAKKQAKIGGSKKDEKGPIKHPPNDDEFYEMPDDNPEPQVGA